MGRIRTVKPEFFLSEDLFDLEVQSGGLLIRLSFVGLWTAADRAGRFHWRPRTLRAIILPHDKTDFDDVLRWLCVGGFVCCYESDGERFGFVESFSRNQVINNREKESTLPDPVTADVQVFFARDGDGWKETKRRVGDASTTRRPRGRRGKEGKGREGEGKGKETKRSTVDPTVDRGKSVDRLSDNGEELDRAYARGVATAIARRVQAKTTKDREFVAKLGLAVAANQLSEGMVVDAAEGTVQVKGVRNRCAYLTTTLQDAMGKDGKKKLDRILATTKIPDGFIKGGKR